MVQSGSFEQSKSSSYLDIYKNITKKHGLKGIYSGLTTSLIGSFFTNAVIFITLEFSKKSLDKLF